MKGWKVRVYSMMGWKVRVHSKVCWKVKSWRSTAGFVVFVGEMRTSLEFGGGTRPRLGLVVWWDTNCASYCRDTEKPEIARVCRN